MIGTESPRAYFLALPRTTRAATGMYLEAQFRSGETCPARTTLEFDRLDRDALARYRLFISDHGASVLGRIPADTAVVTFVRDPLARAISLWRMTGRTPDHPRHAELLANDSSFEWFLQTMVANPMARLLSAAEDAPVGAGWDANPWDGGVLIDRAVARIESCAAVGLHEFHDESIRLIAHRFGWAPPHHPPLLDPVPLRHTHFEPTARAREILATRHAADLAVYSRAAELFERRRRLVDRDVSRRLYERRLACHATDLTQRVVIDVGRSAPGSGWLPSVEVDDGHVRGIGPDGRATIDLPIRLPRFARIEVCCSASGNVAAIDRLTVGVNGMPVALQARFEGGAVVLHGVVPKGAEPPPFTCIEFRTEHNFRNGFGEEATHSGLDFGVAVSSVALMPYEPSRLRATSASPDLNAAPDPERARRLLEPGPTWNIDDDLRSRLDSLDLWHNVEELQRDGYTVVRDIVTHDTIARLRDLALRVTTASGDMARSRESWLPLGFDPQFVDFFQHPVQLALADLVCGKAMLASYGAFARDRHSHPNALHTENAMFLPAPYSRHNFVVSTMLACTDFSREAGGTCFVPGSHLTLVDPSYDESVDLVGAVAPDAPARSLIVWLGGTWHGAFQRMLPGERVSLFSIFTRPQLRSVQDLRSIPDSMLTSAEMRLRLRRADLYDRADRGGLPANAAEQMGWVRSQPTSASATSIEWGGSLSSTGLVRGAV